MTFNRANFITMNSSRLFTAKEVCNIVKDENAYLMKDVISYLEQYLIEDNHCHSNIDAAQSNLAKDVISLIKNGVKQP
jgi:hypothetical protein